MGLLLSILVSCAGVVELIAFYSNLRTSLRVANTEDSDIDNITHNYKKMLTKEYKQAFAEVNGKEVYKEVKTNYTLSPSPKAIFHTENAQQESNISNGITAEVNTSKCLGECINNLETADLKATPTQREKHTFEFNDDDIVNPNCEDENIIVIERNVHNMPFEHEVNHVSMFQDTYIESTPMDTDTFIFLHEPHHIIFDGTDNEFSSNIETIYLLEEPIVNPVHGDRCPSPYPNYEILAPRNSKGCISSELLENPIISVVEIDDENDIETEIINREQPTSNHRSRSMHTQSRRRNRSVSPSRQIIEDDPRFYLQKRRRSKSSSDVCDILCLKSPLDYQVVVQDYWRKSPSPFEQLISEKSDSTTKQFVLVEEIFSDEFKNSLDGVKPKTATEKRKSDFKRKRNNRNRLSQSSIDSTSESRELDFEQTLAITFHDELNAKTKEDSVLDFVSGNNFTDFKPIQEINGSEVQPPEKILQMELNGLVEENRNLVYTLGDADSGEEELITVKENIAVEPTAKNLQEEAASLKNDAVELTASIQPKINISENKVTEPTTANIQAEISTLPKENVALVNSPVDNSTVCEKFVTVGIPAKEQTVINKLQEDSLPPNSLPDTSYVLNQEAGAQKQTDEDEHPVIMETSVLNVCNSSVNTSTSLVEEPSTNREEDVSTTQEKDNSLPSVLLSAPSSVNCSESLVVNDSAELKTVSSNAASNTNVEKKTVSVNNTVTEAQVAGDKISNSNNTTKTDHDTNTPNPGPSTEKKKPEPFWVN